MELIVVGYAGAHSSAKTTTVNRIARLFEDTHMPYAIVTEVARDCPFKIGKNGGYRSEMWIVKEQKEREKAIKEKIADDDDTLNNDYGGQYIVLCDRVIYDCAAYARVLNRRGAMTDEELAEIESVINEYSATKPYDILYLCEPKPIYDDGKRDTDPEFQQEVFIEYKRYIKEKGLIFTIIQ